MVVKTFRGLLADGGQDHIRLQTIKGKVGYRIAKLQTITRSPGAGAAEHIVKIYKTKQTAIDGVIDFTDSDLLACAYYNSNTSVDVVDFMAIIFDTEIFNQDIYITLSDVESSNTCNYYLELEVIPLDDAGAEYTTLKDMRTS